MSICFGQGSRTPLLRTGNGPNRLEWRRLGESLVLCVGVLVAFWPVLIDLLDTLREHSWARVSVVFPLLALLASRGDEVRTPRMVWGWVLILSGILVELVAVGGHVVRFGRVGFVMAAIGLCIARGWCSIRVAMLLLWAIPPPASLVNAMSPSAELFYGGIAQRLLGVFGVSVARVNTAFGFGDLELMLLPADGGVPLAIAMAGFGWFTATIQARSRLGILVSVGRWMLWGVLFQLAIVTVAVWAFTLGVPPDRIRVFLALGSWTLVPITGCVFAYAGLYVKRRRQRTGGGA